MWPQPLSEEARQKKWEEFLADLENSPDPHAENYQLAVWNPFLNNICRVSATQCSNINHKPKATAYGLTRRKGTTFDI